LKQIEKMKNSRFPCQWIRNGLTSFSAEHVGRENMVQRIMV